MKVEFAVLYDDKTWDTTVAEVPDGVLSSDALVNWATDSLGSQLVYRKAVMFTVYSLPAKEEEIDEMEERERINGSGK